MDSDDEGCQTGVSRDILYIRRRCKKKKKKRKGGGRKRVVVVAEVFNSGQTNSDLKVFS